MFFRKYSRIIRLSVGINFIGHLKNLSHRISSSLWGIVEIYSWKSNWKLNKASLSRKEEFPFVQVTFLPSQNKEMALPWILFVQIQIFDISCIEQLVILFFQFFFILIFLPQYKNNIKFSICLKVIQNLACHKRGSLIWKLKCKVSILPIL